MTAGHPSAELLEAQLRALEAFNLARGAAERARQVSSMTREMRMDLARRMEVLREQHRTIVERADEQLRESGSVLQGRAPMRVLIAHRNAWFSDKAAAALRTWGAEIVAQSSNGAQAVGLAVVEQPDLLLVEDVLPMLSGADVVREVREYSPGTRIGAHVAYPERAAALLEAGAHGAWTRQVPPADVSQGLIGLLGRNLQPT